MRKHVICAIAAAAAWAGAAQAELVEIRWFGTVGSISTPQDGATLPAALSRVAIGDAFEAVAVMDTNVATDTNAATSTGEYSNGFVSLTVNIGGNGDDFVSDELLRVQNRPSVFGSPPEDGLTVQAQNGFQAGDAFGTTGTIVDTWDTDAIPTDIDLAVTNGWFYQAIFGDNINGARFSGEVTRITATVVPTPGVLAMVGVGGLAMGRRKR